MHVFFVFVAYAWIGILHGLLVGSTIFAWRSQYMHRQNLWKYAILIFCILLFFESYWIVVFQYFEMKVFSTQSSLLTAFGITASTNLAKSLSPSWHTLISCGLQTAFALWIINRLKNKKVHG
jgi:hypothetical protein